MNTTQLLVTHKSVSAQSWLYLVEQIHGYRRIHNPHEKSDLGRALTIAEDMARVVRKEGVQSYSEDEVLQGQKPELIGSFSERNHPELTRENLFAELCNMPFIRVQNSSGVRSVALVLNPEM